MFLSIFTRLVQRCHQLGKWGLCLTGTALGASIAASLTDRLATEEGSQTHILTWRNQAHLAGASATALGGVSLEHLSQVACALDGQDAHTAHAGGVWGALLQDIGTLLAVKLGADSQGNIHEVLQVLGGTLGATWALVVLCLGVICDPTLGSLGNVLARTGHQNDAALGVQEPGWHCDAAGAHLGSSLDVLEQRLNAQSSWTHEALDTGSALGALVLTGLAQVGVGEVPVHCY